MDFFNYAGLHRDVILYVKSKYYVEDIYLQTSYDPITNKGIFSFFSLFIKNRTNSS